MKSSFVNIKPTPLRVSTITACASVSTEVDLSLFFERVPIAEDADTSETKQRFRVVYASFSPPLEAGQMEDEHAQQRVMMTRGDLPSYRSRCDRRRRPRLIFDNQVTLILMCDNGASSFCVNVKLFRNGRVQLTGAKEPQQGLAAVEYVVGMLREISPCVVGDADALCVANYQVCLINSDFKLGVEVRRNRLHALLTGSQGGMLTTFEPCIYPGVKINFFWNTTSDMTSQAGKCACTLPCTGRGRGDGNGDCRRVTIAVFESGCVIITGAHTMEQLGAAYDFITGFIDANFTELVF